MGYEIATCELAEQRIVSIRERHPQADLPDYLGKALGELFGRLEVLGVAPAGGPLVIYHQFGPDSVDAEVCIPIGHDLSTSGEAHTRVLPAMTVARTLHVGPYDEMGQAYRALTDWITDHGFEVTGPPQERYLNAPNEVEPAGYRTEVEFPVVPKAVAVPA
jgi:effector-binding domain-containing protein